MHPGGTNLAKELVASQTAEPRDPRHLLGAAHFSAAEETRRGTPLVQCTHGKRGREARVGATPRGRSGAEVHPGFLQALSLGRKTRVRVKKTRRRRVLKLGLTHTSGGSGG